ncbi:MAG: sulfatase [Ginsengibacter sp.]
MKIIIRIIFLSVLSCPFITIAQNKKIVKPNILWVTIEDTSPKFIGAYGNIDARTPHMDNLAKNGIRFANAFSTGTVCSPSRSCIITGVKTYKLGTGHHRSDVPIPGFIKGFPYYLKQAGYYVSNNSKTDYNIANAKQFINQTWNESSGEAGWWNRKPGQPFFAVFNFMDSHQSRTMTWPYDQYKKEIFDKLLPRERIGDNDFKLPPIYHESPEMRHQFARIYNSLKRTDNEIGELLDHLKKDHLMDSTIIFFYADHGEGMPRGKTNGIDYGYRVPFVIWFPPMYSYLSPWGKAGSVTDELIDFEDFAPTIIGLAGGDIPDYLKGRIFLGNKRSKTRQELFLSNDRSDNSPDLGRAVTNGRFMYSRNFMPFEPELRYIRYMEIGAIKQQMRTDLKGNLINSFQQSLFAPRAPEMLFDIKNDPWEMNNLADEKQYQDKLMDFRKALKRNIIKERDVLLLPEYETNQISKTTTLYEYRQQDKKFSVKEIYEAASLSGFRNFVTAEKQIELLKNKNSIIRYWAIIGLRCQPKEVLQKYIQEIISAMDDNYLPVSVTSAAIAYDCFDNSKAEEILKQACKNTNMDVALLAINYLLYVQKPEPFTDVINEVKNAKVIYNVKAACNDFLGKMNLVDNNAENEDN